MIQCCVIQGLQEFEKIVHHEEILFYVAVLGMRLLQFCRPSDVALRGGGVVVKWSVLGFETNLFAWFAYFAVRL